MTEAAVPTTPEERAEAALTRLVIGDAGWSADEEPARWLVGTNYVAFGGLHGQPVVFKYFDWLPRKVQEEKALKLFAPTDVVPKVYPVAEESLLVTERLPGGALNHVERELGQEQAEQLYQQLGEALAGIVAAAPGGESPSQYDLTAKMGFDYEFFCQANVATLFDTVVDRCARVLREQEVPHREVLEESLNNLRQNREAVLAYPTFLQMDDFHGCNIIANGAELTGFIDLEMTRYGNEVLLLGAALAMAIYERPERWGWIRRGYEVAKGEALGGDLLNLACVAAPFTQWIRFMWYWTGEPSEFEEGARGWPTRDIKRVVEALATVKP